MKLMRFSILLAAVMLASTCYGGLWIKDTFKEGDFTFILYSNDVLSVKSVDRVSGNVLTIPDHATYDGVEYPVARIEPKVYNLMKYEIIELPTSLVGIDLDQAWDGSYVKRIEYKGSLADFCCLNRPNDFYGIGFSSWPANADVDLVVEGKSLRNLELTSDVKAVWYIFKGWSGLETVVFPTSDVYVADRAFADCRNLRSVEFNGYSSMTDFVETFKGCTSLEDVKLFPIMTRIGRECFYGCSSLRNLVMPTDLDAIEENAFYGCSALTNVELPITLNRLGANAFAYSGIESVTTSVSEIPDGVFSYCRNLRKVTFEPGVERVDCGFRDCISLEEITFPGTCKYVDGVYGCTSLKSFELPEGVIEFGGCVAFSGVEDLFYPASLEEILIYAEGSQLRSLVIEDCDKPQMFYMPTLFPACFKHLYLGRQLTYKDKYGASWMEFEEGFTGLDGIEFGPEVTSIQDYLLAGKYLIGHIVCHSPVPPKFQTDAPPIDRLYSRTTLYVPEGCEEVYRNAPVWKNFESICDTGVPEFGDDAVPSLVDGRLCGLGDEVVEVYNLTGMCLYRGAASACPTLDSGIYLVRTASGRTHKLA